MEWVGEEECEPTSLKSPAPYHDSAGGWQTDGLRRGKRPLLLPPYETGGKRQDVNTLKSTMKVLQEFMRVTPPR